MSAQQTTMAENNSDNTKIKHALMGKWNVWAHLPHDTDWTVKSYKKIYNVDSVEDAVSITETIPDVLVKNCMLFIMRDGVTPMWEDHKIAEAGVSLIKYQIKWFRRYGTIFLMY